MNCDTEAAALEDIDECLSDPCWNEGTCSDSNDDPAIAVDAYVCVCQSGFFGNNCDADLDECSSNPCGLDGGRGRQCLDSTTDLSVPADSYFCLCGAGYSVTTPHSCALVSTCGSRKLPISQDPFSQCLREMIQD